MNKALRATHSRRASDALIEAGRVRVNGAVAGAGDRLREGDVVTLDGARVEWQRLEPALVEASVLEARNAYLVYNKPAGVTCTTDVRVKGNLIEATAGAVPPGQRLFSVGRLDKESTGCLLLTNDGRLPNSLLRAAAGHDKLYRVVPHVRLSDAHLAEMRSGVVITTVAQRDGRAAPPLTARTLPCRVERDGAALLITLQEGRNRQIRKMLEALGYDTLELHRQRFMHVGLEGLRPGCWRALNKGEMAGIRAALQAPPHLA